jgi:thiol:disulfide interchange protein DsbA
MRGVFRSILGVILALLACRALADPAPGIDYRELRTPQRAAPGTEEVLFFFWYRCPHCYEFEPHLARWAAALHGGIVLRRVPVVFDAERATDARIFYALQAIGAEERLRAGLYDAIHLDGGRRLNRRAYLHWVEDWVARNGVDARKFRAALDSPAVLDQVEEARRMTLAYAVEGTPTLAVNGRYIVDADAGSQARMLEIATELLRRTVSPD